MRVRNRRTGKWVELPDDDGLVCTGRHLVSKEWIERNFSPYFPNYCKDYNYRNDEEYWIAEGYNLAKRWPNVTTIKATRT